MRHKSILPFFIFLLTGSACDSMPEASPPTPSPEPMPSPSPWGPIVRLSQSTLDSQTFLNTSRCVAVTADGVIHVAWLEIVVAAPFPGHARQGKIVYSRSSDGGQT